MDIPVKFHYFQKLKLYHDFLKKGRMLESTKKEYWLLGKIILLWAYSPSHQHIGRPLDFSVLISRDREKFIQYNARKISKCESDVEWINKNIKIPGIFIQVVSNLDVFQFTETISRFEQKDIESSKIPQSLKNYTDQFRITIKGFLMGELVHEKKERPVWFAIKYFFVDWFLQIAFWVFIISALIIATSQAVESLF